MPLLEMKDLHTFFHTKRGIVKAVMVFLIRSMREKPWAWWVNPDRERAFLR